MSETPKVDTNALVESYIALRDKKKAMDEAHKVATKPINDAMDKLESMLGSIMAAMAVESLPTAAGTAYTSTTSSVRAADKEAFLAFVQANNAWHMADVRPLKSAVDEYVSSIGLTPPGITFERITSVNVRRS